MIHFKLRSALAVFACFLGAACASPDSQEGLTAREHSSPRIDAIRVDTLVESESLFIARPAFLATGGDGSLYVSDPFYGRVIRFTGSVPTRVYGRKGGGPGELLAAGFTMTLGDSLLLVADDGKKGFQLFDLAGGRYKGEVPFKGIVRTGSAEGGLAWFGALNMASGTSVLGWRIGRSSPVSFGPVPLTYVASQPFAGVNTRVSVGHWADTTLIGYAGSDQLLLLRDTNVVDTVTVPRTTRRGIPSDIVDRTLRDPDPQALFSVSSALFALHRESNGAIVLVHFDQTMQDRLITAVGFVSVLSPDRQRACVDIPLPIFGDIQPVIAFAGDTLLSLEQSSAEGQVKTTVRWLKIVTDNCRWIPLS